MVASFASKKCAIILLLPIFVASQAPDWNNLGSDKITKWLCENHPTATEALFKDESASGSVAYKCQLKFDIEPKPGKENAACYYLYPASMIKAEMANGQLHCEYEIRGMCDRGLFNYYDLCIQFQTAMSFTEAESTCNGMGGWLPDGANVMRQVAYFMNPKKLGYPGGSYWYLGSDKPMLFVYTKMSEEQFPGGSYHPKDDTTSAPFFCLKEGMKDEKWYQNRCTIMKETFKLNAEFHQGSCFMLSQSLSFTPMNGKNPDPLKLHDRCKWFTSGDRAISPMSSQRRDGMDKVRYGRHKTTYVLTTATKNPNKAYAIETDGWAVMNEDKTSTEIKEAYKQWTINRPKLLEMNDNPKSQAVMQPLKVRGESSALLEDVSYAFRGHLVCVTGVTMEDMAWAKCDDGWSTALTENNKAICLKGFTFNDDPSLLRATFDHALNYCQTFANHPNEKVYVAPCDSADALKALVEIMKKQNLGRLGSMFIGAHRNRSLPGNPFFWDMTGLRVPEGIGTNWDTANWVEPNDKDNIEDCIQMFVNHGDYKWNDITCNEDTARGQGLDTVGVVCAKYRMQL